ncbi:MAG TPA: poly-gamma-glutamate biosynthesis protein PgsC [bacterium]|jgi:poly-gamma-glutamate biosynthesis protein PgsC/CapC|nr:poly-gamma-glutamate biosynthesis protein PgsC [bacterium]MDX9804517.1 poly-gamma-glutamate biosynthesis protein PgsC [bacterium]HNW16485.1 poly-gamma-glutamate biosynthesis protein PgsC [bacterium]HPG35399.1 poly-gamma-glutamate biosynthesis protein PgsC [bacterium]HPM45587.1 poly-gamma-glutamate biosynthesis protein PgsC [bacterium]
MGQLVTLSIGLGLVISLLFSELLGVAAGGMIVPGYVALHLDSPVTVIFTLAVSWLTWMTVKMISTVMIIYGRRRTVIMLLVGFLYGAFFRSIGYIETVSLMFDLSIIGYLIPGLIAIWIEKQGLIETFSTLITSSVIVRLLLILITGGENL